MSEKLTELAQKKNIFLNLTEAKITVIFGVAVQITDEGKALVAREGSLINYPIKDVSQIIKMSVLTAALEQYTIGWDWFIYMLVHGHLSSENLDNATFTRIGDEVFVPNVRIQGTHSFRLRVINVTEY